MVYGQEDCTVRIGELSVSNILVAAGPGKGRSTGYYRVKIPCKNCGRNVEREYSKYLFDSLHPGDCLAICDCGQTISLYNSRGVYHNPHGGWGEEHGTGLLDWLLDEISGYHKKPE